MLLSIKGPQGRISNIRPWGPQAAGAYRAYREYKYNEKERLSYSPTPIFSPQKIY